MKKLMKNNIMLAVATHLFFMVGSIPVVLAQGETSAEETTLLEEVVVVGSRRPGRSASDSPVPVDVVSVEDFQAQGDSDMDSLLSTLIPSYNVAPEPISDAATLIRPATLRSLPPDATLVLVNGKRRHRAAVIALLGAGISGGSQGPDLSVIPAIALDRLEVLRDGASAQYGSDAIAGVMNFVLKENAEGSIFDVKWGSFFENDGNSLTLATNIGLPLSDAGFANISFEWKEVDPTSRSVQRTDAQGLIDAGNSNVRVPAQIWGTPAISGDFKLFGNFGLELDSNNEAYAFANWASREVEGGFYYRNPHTRDGVFNGPTTDDGFDTVKVADLTSDGTGDCGPVRIIDNVPDSAALADIAGDPNCYTLYEKFPGGFTPQFGGNIVDLSLAGGVRGYLPFALDWAYDISATVGRSAATFYLYNTINPQLLAQRNDIPTYYDTGGYTETDRTVQLDMSKPFEVRGVPVNVALGLEYRDETFKIDAGEPNSWYIDPNTEHGLATQGFGVGSNGFAGFRPEDEGEHTIRAVAAYLDLESDVTDTLLLGVALRYEDYNQYGDTLDGKLSFRQQLGDNFALRGSVNTGFRVPTAGQANLRNVTTEFQNGKLADIATLPPTNPVAQQKGAHALTPEQSTNFAIGALFNFRDLDVTVDYYNIQIEDRIAFTSRFELTPADIAALLAAGIPDASSFSSVRFFSNQQTVEASGFDVVATLPFEIAGGDSSLTLVANFSKIELAEYNPEFTSENRRQQIEEGRPDSRLTMTWTHLQGPWRFMARTRYYGQHYDAPTNDPAAAYRPNDNWLFDAETSVKVTDSLSLLFGLQNIFDTYPTTNPNGNIAGLIYPEQSPYGFNGGYYYMRATMEF